MKKDKKKDEPSYKFLVFLGIVGVLGILYGIIDGGLLNNSYNDSYNTYDSDDDDDDDDDYDYDGDVDYDDAVKHLQDSINSQK